MVQLSTIEQRKKLPSDARTVCGRLQEIRGPDATARREESISRLLPKDFGQNHRVAVSGIVHSIARSNANWGGTDANR